MKCKIQIRNLHVTYNDKTILSFADLDVFEHEILSVIGPANSGKSTFLRVLNRLLDINSSFRVTGEILLDKKNIYREKVDVYDLRRKVGIIFALPIPLPMSVYDNLAYGPRLHGETSEKKLFKKAEMYLRAASLWEEVKDRMFNSALQLSGGQQQRLCIARTLMVEPEIILFDEPCSGLDPISTAKVEATMLNLKKKYTIILVTNNTKQAARVSDKTAFFLSGKLIEAGETHHIFTTPKNKKTNDYITGRFG